ncbi:hypothetical protein PENNAL_c0386G01183, partial [Penicillium nalgiovense]
DEENDKENDNNDPSNYNDKENDKDDKALPSRLKRPHPTPKHSLTSYGYALTDATIKRLLRGAKLPTDTLKKQLLR